MPGLRGRELAAYVLFSVLWSGNWLVIRVGLVDLPPFLFAGLRLAVGVFAHFALPGEPLTPRSVVAALSGVAGVALVVFGRGARLPRDERALSRPEAARQGKTQ